MDKNYYEILEVDRNASQEIIDKAYKTLAKKYHPDLQDGTHKKKAEETFKMINEAYETLSNPQLRTQYNQELQNHTISEDKYNEMYKQNQILKDKLNNLQQHIYENRQGSTDFYSNQNSSTNHTYQDRQNHTHNSSNAYQNQNSYERNLEYEQQMEKARQKAYHDAYFQDLKNKGYKIRYKKTFSDYIKSFLSILIVIFVLFIIWNIPFVKNYFMELYETNTMFKVIVDIFNNIFH